jgi:branched-chain amino acid transport system ATP-binding protein
LGIRRQQAGCTVLKCAELNVRIDGAEILRNVSMHVPENAFVALVGRNGAGKSTLMRSIMNLIPIHAGTIQIAGRDTTHAQPHSHAGRGVGYMPEDRRLIADWTVEKNILLPIWRRAGRITRSDWRPFMI